MNILPKIIERKEQIVFLYCIALYCIVSYFPIALYNSHFVGFAFSLIYFLQSNFISLHTLHYITVDVVIRHRHPHYNNLRPTNSPFQRYRADFPFLPYQWCCDRPGRPCSLFPNLPLASTCRLRKRRAD